MFTSRSAKQTMAFAKKFAKTLKPGSVVALEGDLGAGKTTFIKGLALGLGLKSEDAVTSPTFAIMHVYETKPTLYHFDLYRLEKVSEVQAIGFEEFIEDPNVICCIEWPQKAGNLIPKSAHRVTLKSTSPTSRNITLK